MKGILFTEEMFRAVTAGRKTQTRRLIPANGLARYKKDEIVYLKEPYEFEGEQGYCADPQRVIYKFDYPLCCTPGVENIPDIKEIKWKNKLFMPAEYARHFIKIKDVSVERLLDISEADAKAEGVEKGRLPGYGRVGIKTYREGFLDLFFRINRDLKTDNPWVFVYTFEMTEKPATSNQQQT
jgi:hypothetical protein